MFKTALVAFLISGVQLIGPGLVLAQKSADADLVIKIDEIRKNSRKAIDEVAPGVEWKQAKYQTCYSRGSQGQNVKSKILVVSGQTKKGQAVEVRVGDMNKIIVIWVVVSVDDLPAPVLHVLREQPSLGKCVEVIAFGQFSEKPYQYKLSFENGGWMVISANARRVQVMTPPPPK